MTTLIEWTHFPDTIGETLNPIRAKYDGSPAEVYLLDQEVLERPLHWRNPRTVFVCSMTDLFGPRVPGLWQQAILDALAFSSEKHRVLFLTKRPERMAAVFEAWYRGRPGLSGLTRREMLGGVCPSFGLGVTAEDQQRATERIPILLKIPAAMRFVSIEPMLGEVDLSAHGGIHCPEARGLLDWAIAGGETGPGARPMNPEWARSLRDQCQAAGVPFFFKQWGEWGESPVKSDTAAESWSVGLQPKRPRSEQAYHWPDGTVSYRVGKKQAGRLLDGREHSEFPQFGAGVTA